MLYCSGEMAVLIWIKPDSNRSGSHPEVHAGANHVWSTPNSRRCDDPGVVPLRVKCVVLCNRRLPVNFRYALLATEIARRCDMSRRARSGSHICSLGRDCCKHDPATCRVPLPRGSLRMSAEIPNVRQVQGYCSLCI